MSARIPKSKLLIPPTFLLIVLLIPYTTTTSSFPLPSAAAATAALHCQSTLFPNLCLSTLLSIPNLSTTPLPSIISSAVNSTAATVISSSHNCSSILRRHHLSPRQRLALSDCIELLDATLDDLHLAVSDLRRSSSRRRCRADLSTFLSAAITNQFTCLDGFAFVPEQESIRPQIQRRMVKIYRHVSNALALSKKISSPENCNGRGQDEVFRVNGKFPTWLTRRNRHLLQAPAPATSIVADLVVAKDGSGNYTTVGEAVAAAPNNSATRFVIYIKAGAYFENVEVGKNKVNLMFVGDGMGKTVIKAGRNVVDGWTTFRSATVAVVGKGFIARDLTVENAAGPTKHQAVALRCGADLSAFYRCSFVGYQDTLYVHSLRQFYRDCDIYGTVDFIFGDAAALFQNCNLYARKPDPNQNPIFTAQGREDPNQNTGISIQRCKITSAAELIPVESDFQSYLGRPWKKYSRTVVLESYIGSLIEPAGWSEWNGSVGVDTLFYGEYMNRGPGSNVSGRVNWSGYKAINDSAEALNFTVGSFIQGDDWLGAYSIPFFSGLS
ncbi:pectinesterase [Dendrobium catenatum]|uniref:Pectinesterase n=1 Tax=Dendrobium catenatum TaxID=906689 RepID=A0A2I0VDY0_9ASPA|nr:pectinesterase [Dendrobium catenatum]PKU61593.1 Pectinesterase 3 [Dendrobium catenatum]